MTTTDGQLPGEQLLKHIDWKEYYQRYNDELDVDTVSLDATVKPGIMLKSQTFPQTAPEGSDMGDDNNMIGHYAFGANSSNWSQLMPEDSITRLRSSEQTYEVFKQIVRETTENAIPGLEIQSNDLCSIAHYIANRFIGFDFSPIEEENTEEKTDKISDLPNNVTIILKTINESNFQDWYIYAVDEPQNYTNSRSVSHTLYNLVKQDVKPVQVLNNVAFEIKETMEKAVVPSVPSAELPDCPVNVWKNDLYEDPCYYKIKSPVQTFGEDWGDIERMRSKLQESPQECKRISKFQNDKIWSLDGGLALFSSVD